MKRKKIYTYDENKLETLTKKMFGEKYTFAKMSEREKGMIKNEYNLEERPWVFEFNKNK